MGQYFKPVSIEKRQFVYSHDYGNGLKLMEHSWLTNEFVRAVEGLIAEGGAWYGDRIVWAGDYAEPEKNRKNNLYHICSKYDKRKVKPEAPKTKFRYVINMDTKEFVDTTKVPITDIWTDESGKEWPFIIHPLPILTCEGNGRGGGDLHKESPLVGIWARCRVTMDAKKPKGFKELEFNLYEGKEPMKLKPKVKKEKVKV
jgi:hypothetical protein